MDATLEAGTSADLGVDGFRPPRVPAPGATLPWYGYFRALRTNALGAWPERAYEEMVFEQRIVGRRILLLNAPDAIHRVLVENAANYRRTPASIRILRPITGRGLILSEGEAWRLQRRTIAPALAPRVLPMLAAHVLAETETAIAALAASVGRPVDLLAAAQHLTLAIAARTMFSLEAAEFATELRAMLLAFAERLGRAHMLDLLLPPWVPTWHDLGRARFRRRWVRLIARIVAPRLAAPEPELPRDLFDLLRRARDPETGAGFSQDQLIDQTATMIVAGHETTALTLFWSLYLLAHAPAAQARVAAEAAALDLSPAGGAAALPLLVTTRAVVSEALRLFPPAFAIVRQTIADDRCGALAIPAGIGLMIWPWVLHRHRRLWRDPDLFDPSRFLPGAPPVPRFGYMPFGAGPRVCVGAQFALAEATLALAAIIRRFQVTQRTEREVLPVALVTTQPDHAPAFRLHDRETQPAAVSGARPAAGLGFA